jgi:hypothetical protein
MRTNIWMLEKQVLMCIYLFIYLFSFALTKNVHNTIRGGQTKGEW